VHEQYPSCLSFAVKLERRRHRKGGTHRIKDFERKAHSVLQAATVLIVATVGEWREELVQQIAVRAVELRNGHPEGGGAA